VRETPAPRSWIEGGIWWPSFSVGPAASSSNWRDTKIWAVICIRIEVKPEAVTTLRGYRGIRAAQRENF
jgi:hypothetical protein